MYWPEIIALLKPGEKAEDRRDLITRVFHLKSQEMLDLIVNDEIFGKVDSYIYSIEFQVTIFI